MDFSTGRVKATWGHKPRPNGGKRRPRPIGGVYRKLKVMLPRGDLPPPPPAIRRRGIEALLRNGEYVVPLAARTGCTSTAVRNEALCVIYTGIRILNLDIREGDATMNDGANQCELKKIVTKLRTIAAIIRKSVRNSGGLAVNEPIW